MFTCIITLCSYEDHVFAGPEYLHCQVLSTGGACLSLMSSAALPRYPTITLLLTHLSALKSLRLERHGNASSPAGCSCWPSTGPEPPWPAAGAAGWPPGCTRTLRPGGGWRGRPPAGTAAVGGKQTVTDVNTSQLCMV